jgi:LPS O-antigen subunit length determinant protein (WzzB/FepE family)
MQDETLQTAGGEISLKDLVDFFKGNWHRILFYGVAGLLLSLAYVALSPKEYGAIWQMQMAQVSNNNPSNIEEPVALIERLRFSTAYPVEVQQKCGMPNDQDIGDYLNKKLEVQVIKNLSKVVQFKYRSNSPVQAKQCAETIMTMVLVQQRSLIEQGFAGRKMLLAQYQKSLAEEQRQLEKMKKSELGFGYLARLDKLSGLRTRIDTLQEEISLSQMHPTQLIAPIYVPSKPISPKIELVLLLGISFGLILGVLYALGREICFKML